MNARVLPILLLVLAISLLCTTAAAATVARLDMDGLVERSDAIVIARVTSIEARRHDDGRVYSTIELQVQETLKGSQQTTLTIRQIGGRDLEADIATYVPGMPEFEVEERVFLFLREGRGETPSVTGLSQGKFTIAIGPDNGTEFVIPRLSELHLIDDPHARQDRPSATTPSSELGHRTLFHQVHDLASFRRHVEELIELQSGDLR
jgi:hypothetical protein